MAADLCLIADATITASAWPQADADQIRDLGKLTVKLQHFAAVTDRRKDPHGRWLRQRTRRQLACGPEANESEWVMGMLLMFGESLGENQFAHPETKFRSPTLDLNRREMKSDEERSIHFICDTSQKPLNQSAIGERQNTLSCSGTTNGSWKRNSR
jgi:hypothetical protein